MGSAFSLIGASPLIDTIPHLGDTCEGGPAFLLHVTGNVPAGHCPSAAVWRGLFQHQVGGLTMTKILIADDHEVVRSGLRLLLGEQANWKVVAEASDGPEAVSKAAETKPDVAVVDYSLPRLNGLEVTRQIRSRLPNTEVLIFTMYENELLILEALRAGARGYLLKSDAKEQLVEAIRSLTLHRPFFRKAMTDEMVKAYAGDAGPERSAITQRERMVVQLIAEGYANKAIATTLNIS